MKVQLPPGTRPLQTRARRSSPDEAYFTKTIVPALVAAEMVVPSLGSLYASPAMTAVKPSSVKVKGLADRPKAKNENSLMHMEAPDNRIPLALPVTQLATSGRNIVWLLTTVSLIHILNQTRTPSRCWMSKVSSSQVIPIIYPWIFTRVSGRFLCMKRARIWKPRLMPQGCCNATAHFMGVMNHILGSLIGEICVVYVDDIFMFAKSELELVRRTRMVLERLHRQG